MTTCTPTTKATGSYQTAREVALRLPQHPGETAQGLYRLYLDRFSALNCERNSAAAMITQHLKALEEDGLVISEKPEKKGPGNTPKWTWVGPLPSAYLNPDEKAQLLSGASESSDTAPDPDSWQPDTLAPYDSATDTPTAEESSADDSDLRHTEADPLQQAIALLQAAAKTRRVPDTLVADLVAVCDALDDISDAAARAATALSKIVCDLS